MNAVVNVEVISLACALIKLCMSVNDGVSVAVFGFEFERVVLSFGVDISNSEIGDQLGNSYRQQNKEGKETGQEYSLTYTTITKKKKIVSGGFELEVFGLTLQCMLPVHHSSD